MLLYSFGSVVSDVARAARALDVEAYSYVRRPDIDASMDMETLPMPFTSDEIVSIVEDAKEKGAHIHFTARTEPEVKVACEIILSTRPRYWSIVTPCLMLKLIVRHMFNEIEKSARLFPLVNGTDFGLPVIMSRSWIVSEHCPIVPLQRPRRMDIGTYMRGKIKDVMKMNLMSRGKRISIISKIPTNIIDGEWKKRDGSFSRKITTSEIGFLYGYENVPDVDTVNEFSEGCDALFPIIKSILVNGILKD